MVACRPWTGILRLPLCEVFEVAQPSGSVRVVYRLWFDMTTRPQAFATTCGASERCECSGQCATSRLQHFEDSLRQSRCKDTWCPFHVCEK